MTHSGRKAQIRTVGMQTNKSYMAARHTYLCALRDDITWDKAKQSAGKLGAIEIAMLPKSVIVLRHSSIKNPADWMYFPAVDFSTFLKDIKNHHYDQLLVY